MTNEQIPKDLPDFTETHISSELVFEGKMLNVRVDQVRLTDGNLARREWIDHAGAAAALPLFENGDVLLVRQFRYPTRLHYWEVPAGKADRVGEDLGSLARRELVEETGWEAQLWTRLGLFYPTIGYSSEVIELYLAEDLKYVGWAPDEGEFLTPIRMPFSEVLAMADRGEIGDEGIVGGGEHYSRKPSWQF